MERKNRKGFSISLKFCAFAFFRNEEARIIELEAALGYIWEEKRDRNICAVIK